jgi:glutamine amidotransferase
MSARPAAPRLAIVDYGMGNRRSVEKALERAGARVLITADHDELRRADGLVLPGVGAFPRAMANLHALGLDVLLSERARSGTPILGVCLGLQLLFESSEELGGARGLGLLAGRCERLEAGELKLPHIGWNLVRFRRASPLTEGLPNDCAFYHVHSFAARPDDDAVVVGLAEYGSPFVSAVERHPLYGVQFHPEKSSAAGLRLLGNFAGIVAAAGAPAAA